MRRDFVLGIRNQEVRCQRMSNAENAAKLNTDPAGISLPGATLRPESCAPLNYPPVLQPTTIFAISTELIATMQFIMKSMRL